MFALAAAILWVLVAFGVNPPQVSLIWIGAACLAAHFAINIALPFGRGGNQG